MDDRGMGTSGHPGDVEGSASMGDFVDDLTCVLKHGEVTGKPICIGLVPAFPEFGLTQAGTQPQVQGTGGVSGYLLQDADA